MTPTPRLRFVSREAGYELYEMHGSEPCYQPKTIRILQQWWEQGHSVNIGWGDITIGETKGEWRDVPLEEE